MYPRYNIPQTGRNMQTSPNYYYGMNNNSGDRFIAGGFLGPFILGGIAGSLINNRPQGPIYGPIYGPPPIIYYPPRPMPYYNSTVNYY